MAQIWATFEVRTTWIRHPTFLVDSIYLHHSPHTHAHATSIQCRGGPRPACRRRPRPRPVPHGLPIQRQPRRTHGPDRALDVRGRAHHLASPQSTASRRHVLLHPHGQPGPPAGPRPRGRGRPKPQARRARHPKTGLGRYACGRNVLASLLIHPPTHLLTYTCAAGLAIPPRPKGDTAVSSRLILGALGIRSPSSTRPSIDGSNGGVRRSSRLKEQQEQAAAAGGGAHNKEEGPGSK